jgi:DNA-binding HxlR family transcriptional regulator
MSDRPHSTKMCRRFQSAVDLLGKRWTPLIVQLLLGRPRRYSELHEELEVVTEGMLSQRLKELERAGVVERRVLDEQPVRVEYHLTDKGRALSRVISGLEKWADEWMDPGGQAAAQALPASGRARRS